MGLDEILMKDSLGKSRLQCLTGVRALQSITENLTWFLKIKTTELYKGSVTSKRPTKYILKVQGVSLADGPYIIWLICNAKGNCWRWGGGGDVSSRYAGKLYRYLNSEKHSKDKNCRLLLERSGVLNDKHRSFIRCPLEWIFRSWLSFAGLFKSLILKLTSLATCAVAQDHTQALWLVQWPAVATSKFSRNCWLRAPKLSFCMAPKNYITHFASFIIPIGIKRKK